MGVSRCPSCTLLYSPSQKKMEDSKAGINTYGVIDNCTVKAVDRAVFIMCGGLASVWYSGGALQVARKGSSSSAFSIPQFHVSCRSDQVKDQMMMGVVLYLCEDKALFYLNGMKCRSGYILLGDSDKISKVPGGTMHDKTFRYFVGESLSSKKIVGGGFSVQKGTPVFRSGTFNTAATGYHNNDREMHILEKQCITAAINNWKKGVQNTKVSDVCGTSVCDTHGAYD